MAPKLYGILGSPPVRAVLMCAKEIGLELEFVNVNLFEGEHLKEEFLKKNPQHTVPFLEDEDGFQIANSHVIMKYLVLKYGKNSSLYPKDDIKKSAIIDHILFFDDGILFARAGAMVKLLIYKDIQPSQESIDNYKEALQILDRILDENKTDFIAGTSLTIADFNVTSTVTSFDSIVKYSEFPQLKAYIGRIQKLPFYEANVEGLNILNTVLNSKIKK